jgi:hypothetical protein
MTQESKEDKRVHRIKADFGSGDYYKHFATTTGHDEIGRAIFGEVMRKFNDHVRGRISTKGAEYFMPCRTGKIELRKIKTEVKIDEDGNVINNLPPNWKATRELWDENPAAKEKKIKIRYTNEHTDGHTFRIFYKRSKANFKNKTIYKMRFNRTMKRQLSKAIFAGKIDAFLR